MVTDEALKRRLSGEKDSRSTQGIMSRGNNVYKGGVHRATSGPLKNPKKPQVQQPSGNPDEQQRQAILRRLQLGRDRQR
jgi:hypothetical protein